MKLTKRDVLLIFSQRAQVCDHSSNALTSRELAAKFGISERTVRDIWTRRSRTGLTKFAWTPEEARSGGKTQLRTGRPPGAKDAAPRKRARGSDKTDSSDTGTQRDSDTTASRRNQTCESNSNSSDQHRGSSSPTSTPYKNSSRSGDSSPNRDQTFAAPPNENTHLNEEVLSLLSCRETHCEVMETIAMIEAFRKQTAGSIFARGGQKGSVSNSGYDSTSSFSNNVFNMPAPMQQRPTPVQQPPHHPPEPLQPAKPQDAFQSAPNLAQHLGSVMHFNGNTHFFPEQSLPHPRAPHDPPPPNTTDSFSPASFPRQAPDPALQWPPTWGQPPSWSRAALASARQADPSSYSAAPLLLPYLAPSSAPPLSQPAPAHFKLHPDARPAGAAPTPVPVILSRQWQDAAAPPPAGPGEGAGSSSTCPPSRSHALLFAPAAPQPQPFQPAQQTYRALQHSFQPAQPQAPFHAPPQAGGTCRWLQ